MIAKAVILKIISLLFFCGMLFLAYQIINKSNLASTSYQEVVNRLDLNSQTELAWKTLLEQLTLSLYEGASETSREIQQLQDKASSQYADVSRYSIMFLFVSILYLVAIFFLLNKKNEPGQRQLETDLILLAFICLVIGVSTPILNLIAFKELPVVGMVVLKYESKSILSIIDTLWSKQNYLVCCLVFLFSFLIPFLKLFFIMAVKISSQSQFSRRLSSMINLIGKWSMTDVFVVAVLLAVFTLNTDESTDAWIGHGLYFFVSYAILSMFLGFRASPSDNQRQQK